ncbi:MAG TPA: hypothetical protein VHG08_28915 [Longimicrobium sp.]|nr:hypothetical protein [Longimicrobium sp.]
MTSPYRITARLPAFAAALACALSLALPAHTAAQDPEEPRRFCMMGRPQPSCEMLLFAQFSYYPRIQGSDELEEPIEWEIGALVNRGPREAVGGTVVLGFDGNGARTAVKARYRRWLSRYAAFDAAGGVAWALRDGVPPAFADRPAFGVTGDLGLGFTDWASVGVRGDLLWSDGEPVGATSAMVRLGTIPGAVFGIITLVAFVSVMDDL